MNEPTREQTDQQDIRVAVVMNGGLSLAVWISGVTQELYCLAMARATDELSYRPLLELLDADARVDVIAGTSAGGLNGAFLALGLVRHRGVRLLRDLWVRHGSLQNLLRDPLRPNPPSLLDGNGYFLPQVLDALRGMCQPASTAVSDDRPIELILTGTLWNGRTTSFTDDMGAAIRELDHDATFRFVRDSNEPSLASQPANGDLADDSVVDHLAEAARCTSSFPGAFEPRWVEVGGATGAADGRYASTAGRANFSDSQFVVDGGVLLNKPIRPALEAIYNQTAESQVRRLLAYVAPGAGEAADAVGDAQPTASSTRMARDTAAGKSGAGEEVPRAHTVLLGVLTRLRSTDSVSRELAEIRKRNAEAHARRRARDRLATAMVAVADTMSAEAWLGYIEVRVDLAARTIGHLLTLGQPSDEGRWSEVEMVDGLRRVLFARRKQQGESKSPALFFVPHGQLADAVDRSGQAWDWGATTVQRLGDMTVDVLKRAVWLAPIESDDRKEIVQVRGAVGEALNKIRADQRSLNRYWLSAASGRAPGPDGNRPPMPRRVADTTRSATNARELENWLDSILDGWDDLPGSPGGGERRARLHEQATALAGCLADGVKPIGQVLSHKKSPIDPDDLERDRLIKLYAYLFPGAPAKPEPADLLRQMLRLDVVQLSFAGASDEVEQEVELIQFGARHPKALTGLQLHHFGAFHRPSWRVNDWIHGRLDAVDHIVRMLLSAERLRQRGSLLASRGLSSVELAERRQDRQSRFLNLMHECAVPSYLSLGDREFFEEDWVTTKRPFQEFIGELVSGPKDAAPPDATKDRDFVQFCCQAIARPIRLRVLREDLPALADAIRSEGDDAPEKSRTWLSAYEAAMVVAALSHTSEVPAPELEKLWCMAAQVGGEHIADEIGGDTFARTAATAVAVTATTAAAFTKPKTIATVVTALRGYALAVWAMVTFMSGPARFGVHAVELATAAGAVLLAVGIFVPAMPLAFTLAGTLLILAGVSTAALLTEHAKAKGIGWRMAGAALVVLAALGGYVWWDWRHNGLDSTVVSLLVKLFVAVLVVLLGWWIARARPSRRG